jgi:large subunit ribosomal protein L23
VPVDANKVEIRQAVEKIFKVKVKKVNTLRVMGKARRRGWASGRTPDWKKAMVTLNEGDTIEIL